MSGCVDAVIRLPPSGSSIRFGTPAFAPCTWFSFCDAHKYTTAYIKTITKAPPHPFTFTIQKIFTHATDTKLYTFEAPRRPSKGSDDAIRWVQD